MENQELLNKVAQIDDYVRSMRGYLHQNPELSGREYQTKAFLMNELKMLNLDVEEVTNTGFIAILDTGKAGKTIALRADIDALPITESEVNLAGKRKWLSKTDGVMHACGHDGHMAALLGAANILVSIKDALKGKIIFIFEEGEETASGIHGMLEYLKSKKIDAIYGNHLVSFLDTGTISVDAGAVMGGYINIDMQIKGRAGHGSRPDLSINPVFAAAQVLNGISSAWNNQLNVEETVTLGLTQIHGGSANNIIPDSVYIGGSLRYFDHDTGVQALELVKSVATLTAQAHKCHVEFGERCRMTAQPLVNDSNLAIQVQRGIAELYADKLIHGVRWFSSESFSYYRQIAPSVFAFVGMRNKQIGSGAEHHNELFDLDEDALQYSVGSMVKFAYDFLLT